MKQLDERPWQKWLLIFVILLLSLPWIDGANAGLRIVFHTITILLFGIWLINLIRRGESLPTTPLDVPLLFVFLTFTIATIFSVFPRVSVEGLWVVGTYILFFYFFVYRARRYGLRSLVEPIFFIVALMMLLGVFELAIIWLGWPQSLGTTVGWFDIGGFDEFFPPIMPRLGGFLTSNANRLATYLAAFIPVFVTWGLTSKDKQTRVGLLLLAAGSLFITGLTFSRGGLLSLAISTCLIIALTLIGMSSVRQRLVNAIRDWRIVVSVLTVTILGGSIFVFWAQQRLWRLDEKRLVLWRTASRAGLEHPITGLGPGMFGFSWFMDGDPFTLPDYFAHPHNIPLTAWSEGGLFGIAGLIVLVGAIVWAIYKHWKQATEPMRIRLAGFAGGLTGFAVYSLVDVFFNATPGGMTMALPVIVMAAYIVTPLKRPSHNRRMVPATLLSLLILASAGWIVSDRAQYQLEESLKLAESGDLTGALTAIRRAEQIDPTMEFYPIQEAMYLGQLAAEDESYLDPAIEAFEVILQENGFSDTLRANYAALLAQRGDYDSALSMMQQAEELDTDEPVYKLWIGAYAETLSDDQLAREAYQQTLELRPKWLTSNFWQQTPLRQQALDAFLDAHEVDDIPIEVLDALPTYCWPGVINDEWYWVNPPIKSEELYCQAEQDLKLHGDTTQVIELLDEAEAHRRGMSYILYYTRAEAYAAMGEIDQAEQAILTARFLNNPQASYFYGQLLESQGKLEEAERAYQATASIVSLNKKELTVYHRLGQIDYLPQLKVLAASEKFDPLLALYRLYEREGRQEEAEMVYQTILEIVPYAEIAPADDIE